MGDLTDFSWISIKPPENIRRPIKQLRLMTQLSSFWLCCTDFHKVLHYQEIFSKKNVNTLTFNFLVSVNVLIFTFQGRALSLALFDERQFAQGLKLCLGFVDSNFLQVKWLFIKHRRLASHLNRVLIGEGYRWPWKFGGQTSRWP